MSVDLSALPVLAQMREIRHLAHFPGRGRITIAASRAGFILSRCSHDDLFIRNIDQAVTPHFSDGFMRMRAVARIQKSVRLAVAHREGESA